MALETTTTIAGLDPNNPVPSDPVGQGDDHLRLIKTVLKDTFPGSSGVGFSVPITATETQLNGLTSGLKYVSNIAALRNTSFLNVTSVATNGYYTAGDSGNGTYWYDSTDTTSVDDNGSIIVATDGGRWKLFSIQGINVKQFGANGDGITNDTTAIDAALAAARSAKVAFIFPIGNYLYSGTVYNVTSIATLLNRDYANSVVTPSQARVSMISCVDQTPDISPLDGANSRVPIAVTVRAYGACHAAGINTNLVNFSTDGNGNTALYASGVGGSTAALWTSALHGETRHAGGSTIALNTESASYDNSGGFFGVVVGNSTATAPATHPITGLPSILHDGATGVYINGRNDISPKGGWKYGILVSGNSLRTGSTTISIEATSSVVNHIKTSTLSPSSVADIMLQGNSACGLMLEGNYTSTAIRMKVGESISWEATTSIRTNYNSATVTWGIYTSQTTERASFNVSASPYLKLNATKVVGIRDTGWTAFTGITNKATGYATSTITLQQLAERVAALQVALTTHGLVGA